MAARWRVVWIEHRPERRELLKLLEESGCEVILGRPFTDAANEYTPDEVRALIADADAIMVGTREHFPKEVLAAGKKLSTVAKLGIGVERIDIPGATELGILVSNTPVEENYLGVAEATLARILAMAKDLKVGDRNARAGKWRSVTNVYLKGKAIGIVGFGRIGRRVADLFQPWDVQLLAYDPYIPEAAIREQGVEPVSLEELLQRSDFVTLHVVATPENRKLIGAPELALMKPTSYLVNTARGVVLDEIALAQALQEGRIAGAAIDVFEPEPPPPDHPLLAEELFYKTIYSPHTASSTPELETRMPAVMVENTLRALRGEVPEFLVNPEAIPAWRARFGATIG
ncbi:MAG TPA: NAD(P)-dependent oxidoreductase [Dehalococcoidia bacterium]|nr:NAD(P)-dependent oxidoreductase [Dehalococcoidia bacterium]